MKKFASSFLKPRIPLLIFLICYIFFSLATYKNYGVTVDERDVYLRGKLFYTKVKGNDKVLQKDFVIKEEGVKNDLLFYDNTHAALLYLQNDKEDFEIYHLENLLFAAAIFIALYETILRATKNKWYSLSGIVFLAVTPRFFGDIPSNPKDIPFAVYYFISLALICLSMRWEEKARMIILGISFGLTQASRIVGYSIYPVFFIFRALLLLKDRKKGSTLFLKKAVSLLLEIATIFFIGYLIHILSVPYLGADPFNHFVDLLKSTKAYPWDGTFLLFGKTYSAQQPQLIYLPVWIVITTPIFIMLLSLFSLKELSNTTVQLFVISLITNLSIYFITKPVLYDGLRHMIFLIPHIVVLAVFGLRVFLQIKKKAVKTIGTVLIVINIVLVIHQYVQLHPYEYVYFNEIIGGLRGAHKQFETDYWSESFSEAGRWLKKYLLNRKIYKAKIGICGSIFSAEYYFKDMKYVTFNLITSKKTYFENDYAISWDRTDQCKKMGGRLIYVINREGVPLAYIYEITKK